MRSVMSKYCVLSACQSQDSRSWGPNRTDGTVSRHSDLLGDVLDYFRQWCKRPIAATKMALVVNGVVHNADDSLLEFQGVAQYRSLSVAGGATTPLLSPICMRTPPKLGHYTVHLSHIQINPMSLLFI